MLALREAGVNFTNASAIATGHYLGDTGDFSNTIYSGYPVFDSGNFGSATGTLTPFVENNQILGDLDSHFGGNYLNEETLLELARLNGYNTASVGKVGPVGIQDVSQLLPSGRVFTVPQTVFIDDATGTAAGIPLRADIASAITTAGLPLVAPNRSNGCAPTAQCNNGFSGNNTTPPRVPSSFRVRILCTLGRSARVIQSWRASVRILEQRTHRFERPGKEYAPMERHRALFYAASGGSQPAR